MTEGLQNINNESTNLIKNFRINTSIHGCLIWFSTYVDKKNKNYTMALEHD